MMAGLRSTCVNACECVQMHVSVGERVRVRTVVGQ